MDEIKQISTRVPLDLYIKVKIKAAQTGKTMTDVIRERLEEWVEKEAGFDAQTETPSSLDKH